MNKFNLISHTLCGLFLVGSLFLGIYQGVNTLDTVDQNQSEETFSSDSSSDISETLEIEDPDLTNIVPEVPPSETVTNITGNSSSTPNEKLLQSLSEISNSAIATTQPSSPNQEPSDDDVIVDEGLEDENTETVEEEVPAEESE